MHGSGVAGLARLHASEDRHAIFTRQALIVRERTERHSLRLGQTGDLCFG